MPIPSLSTTLNKLTFTKTIDDPSKTYGAASASAPLVSPEEDDTLNVTPKSGNVSWRKKFDDMLGVDSIKDKRLARSFWGEPQRHSIGWITYQRSSRAYSKMDESQRSSIKVGFGRRGVPDPREADLVMLC
ncbi:hypothetical protein BSLG_005551 [Batrachochytrium salamandrivorans]|nr:hypothetical protein BASA60_001231 [Batrachochytrium salamandrivorans]KAJ1339813.1 hypothetical protein BSLG_005551 [Batrachochytrium salamandrivorans]